MKKLLYTIRVLMLTTLFLGITFATSSPTYAKWYCIHGVTAQVEDESVILEAYRDGEGLHFFLDWVESTWVHLAVPSEGGAKRGARYIRLKFYTSTEDAWVSEIRVFNGNIHKKTLTGTWANGWKDIKLNLGRVINFNRGLDIAVKVNAGEWTAIDHWFIFSGACANFVKKP